MVFEIDMTKVTRKTDGVARQWLYHKSADATIFHGQEAIDKALSEGWVDTPEKFKKKDIEAKVVQKRTRQKKQTEVTEK